MAKLKMTVTAQEIQGAGISASKITHIPSSNHEPHAVLRQRRLKFLY